MCSYGIEEKEPRHSELERGKQGTYNSFYNIFGIDLNLGSQWSEVKASKYSTVSKCWMPLVGVAGFKQFKQNEVEFFSI